MDALRNPRVATVLMIVMIAAAIVLGGGRSLRALAGDVEDIFWNGERGDGIGVASDLSANRDDAYNLLSVARGYDGVQGGTLNDLSDAVAQADAAGDDLNALHSANTNLVRAVTALYEELGRQPLSGRDEGYRQDLYHSILSRADTMSRDGYNAAAQEFNQKLGRFPASVLRVLAGVDPAPLFR